MIIESLKLKNYRQYLDEKIIFAKPEENKNFTVIQGVTGAGKTNILNAISWCFYGNEKHLGEKYRGLPVISIPTLEKIKPNDNSQVEVEIQMLDEELKRMIFRRTLTFHKSDDGDIRSIPDPLSNSPDGSKFEMMRQIKREMIVVSSPIYVLGRLIPESLEEYFFFDGERLNDYFKETGNKIRKEVFKISQLDLLEKALRHLNDKRKDFLKSSKLSSKAEEIKATLDVYERDFKKYKNEIEIKVQDKEQAEKMQKEYEEKLKTSPQTSVKGLQNERNSIQSYLEKIGDDLEDIEEEKLDYLIKVAPSIFAYNPVIQTSKVIIGKEAAGDIPTEYKRNFIQKLLRTGKCICGTDISTKNEFRENVTQLLDQCAKISDIEDELMREDVHLKSIIEEIKNFNEKLISYNNKIRKLEREKTEKTARLNEISEEIKKYGDPEQIGLWESKREEYAKIKDELLIEIGKQRANSERAEKDIEKLRKQLKDELEKEEKYKKLRKILNFCDQSLEGLENIKNEIMEDLRKELEEKTKRQFFDLHWKKEEYKDVKIDEEYRISVIHRSGREAIGTLSAGERQVLALSFMAALNSVSGFDVPIIIDTPLGRLAREPKRNIANNLPNYLKGKQVILLVTEEEYTSEVRDRLFERVGKEYRIDFTESAEGGIAKVIPYG